MITAPSTIKPKSNAPRLIKFPETLFLTMPVIVISIEIGITAAVINAALIFPSSRNKTTITNKAPSKRFFSTVVIALLTKSVRSYIGFAFIPSGKVLLISCNFTATLFATSWLFSPINIIAVPRTVSSPFFVAEPLLRGDPN